MKGYGIEINLLSYVHGLMAEWMNGWVDGFV
jgi:hypothetical protein